MTSITALAMTDFVREVRARLTVPSIRRRWAAS